MVRRMKAIITQIESTVTSSGNSGHVVVPKAWIGSRTKLRGRYLFSELLPARNLPV
jgi:putative transposon-encoded protein